MLQKSSMIRTLEVFFRSPGKWHYLLDISRRIRLSHTSVKSNLVKLSRLGLIEESIEKRGRRKFPVYRAKPLNRVFRLYKMLHNLGSVLESGIVEFLEEKATPKSIVLFGSYRRGEDMEESDIDIFVECKPNKFSLGRFEKLLDRKIELHFNENFPSYPKELKNNIMNGIVLSGFLEGYK